MATLSVIKQLELAPMAEDQVQLTHRAKCSATFQKQKGQGFVDAGALVFFMSKISSLHKSDVLNSGLLAQLTVDKQYDQNEEADKWNKIYVHVLLEESWLGCSRTSI